MSSLTFLCVNTIIPCKTLARDKPLFSEGFIGVLDIKKKHDCFIADALAEKKTPSKQTNKKIRLGCKETIRDKNENKNTIN